MANYNRVLTWIPNDTINIPQFPDYLSGTNAGLGTDLIEAGAKFKTGPHPVAIGDVVMTYDVNNLPVEIVQIVEVVTDTLCTVSSAITAGLVYRIYRSNGGSPNIKQGYDGYNFRITAVVAPASNHDLNVIPAGQTTESLLTLAWIGVTPTGSNSGAYDDVKVTRILATGSTGVEQVIVLGEADN
tara:strand:+ start:44 stop:598 length:555 start_codon:yes stop_codon:yes gene_type:complete